jgi:hypothetical protein
MAKASDTPETPKPVISDNPVPELPESADLYELKGKDTAITFRDSGEDGGPVLTLDYKTEFGEIQETFTGDEIHRLDGTVGSLVSVPVLYIADGGSLDLLIFFPEVNIRNGEEEAISTVAVLANQRTTIAGPGILDGQIETYEAITLTGIADTTIA